MKLAVIGLDTSHATKFAELLQSPNAAPDLKATGMRATTCLRFMTPFTDEGVLSERTSELESWGVTVTESYDEAVADVDAILIEINDPALHLEYFEKCAELGKPIFLDKPFAGLVRSKSVAKPFVVDMSKAYAGLLRHVVGFFTRNEQPVSIEDSREVMRLLEAADKSLTGGAAVAL